MQINLKGQPLDNLANLGIMSGVPPNRDLQLQPAPCFVVDIQAWNNPC